MAYTNLETQANARTWRIRRCVDQIPVRHRRYAPRPSVPDILGTPA